jgi:hypothetical protein
MTVSSSLGQAHFIQQKPRRYRRSAPLAVMSAQQYSQDLDHTIAIIVHAGAAP